MCDFSYLILLSSLMMIRAQPNVVIYQNVAGLQALAAPVIQVPYETNLTLTCAVINVDRNEDDQVIWRKRKKLQFSNVLKVLTENIPDALLLFMPATFRDRGVYMCTSLKYKINKVVRVVISPVARTDVWSRRKRFDNYDYGTSNFQNSYPKWDIPTPPSNKYGDDDDEQQNGFHQTDILLKFLYIMGGGFAFFTLLYIIVKCFHDDGSVNDTRSDGNRPENRNRSSRRTRQHYRHASNGTSGGNCLHFICVRNRQRNPIAGCIFEGQNRTNQADFEVPLTAIIHNSDDGALRTDSLDLPPTYEHSTANSATGSLQSLHDATDGFGSRILNAGLPPSYEDALVNIVLSEPDAPPMYESHSEPSASGDNDGGGGGDNSGGGGDSGGGDSGGGGGDSGGGGGDSGGGGGDD